MAKHPDRSKVYAREAAKRAVMVDPYAVEDAKWEALAEERRRLAVVAEPSRAVVVRVESPAAVVSRPPASVGVDRRDRYGAGSDALLRLRRNVAYRAELDAEISELVEAARSAGVTWARIGRASGLSRDGAVSRWGRRRLGTP
jgi:hypothetical protein